MAKKRRSRQIQTPARSRYVIATPRVQVVKRQVAPFKAQNLRLLEDRRLYNPWRAAMRPVYSLPRAAARIVVKQVPAKTRKAVSQSWAGLQFANPRRVLICVRRKIRRGVLHANGSAGSKNLRKPRRNSNSGVSC